MPCKCSEHLVRYNLYRIYMRTCIPVCVIIVAIFVECKESHHDPCRLEFPVASSSPETYVLLFPSFLTSTYTYVYVTFDCRDTSALVSFSLFFPTLREPDTELLTLRARELLREFPPSVASRTSVTSVKIMAHRYVLIDRSHCFVVFFFPPYITL